MCDYCAESLKAQGYHVICTENAGRALRILQQAQVDLLLPDIVIPGISGYQLAVEVQKQYPAIKIQLVSGYSGEKHFEAVDQNLHNELLKKSYQSRTLLRRIRTLLDADS